MSEHKNGLYQTTLRINRGHGRMIPRQHMDGIKVHRSVKLRMEAEGMNYIPKAMWDVGVEPTWVD